MSLKRITHAVAVGAITGALALTAWSAQAGGTADAPVQPAHHRAHAGHYLFVAPVPHKYGANGMRMGLHCETKDMT